VNVLDISCTGHTAMKLAGEILNVLAIYRVGMGWVLYPFPCNVLVMSQPGTPPLAPSVSWSREREVSEQVGTGGRTETYGGDYGDDFFTCAFRISLGAHPCAPTCLRLAFCCQASGELTAVARVAPKSPFQCLPIGLSLAGDRHSVIARSEIVISAADSGIWIS